MKKRKKSASGRTISEEQHRARGRVQAHLRLSAQSYADLVRLAADDKSTQSAVVSRLCADELGRRAGAQEKNIS